MSCKCLVSWGNFFLFSWHSRAVKGARDDKTDTKTEGMVTMGNKDVMDKVSKKQRKMTALPDRSVMIIRLTTKNDTNGNPRRLSLIINGDEGPLGRWQAGAIVAALDEGYVGPSVATYFIAQTMQAYYNLTVVQGPTFEVPPSEYNATKKQHGRKGGGE